MCLATCSVLFKFCTCCTFPSCKVLQNMCLITSIKSEKRKCLCPACVCERLQSDWVGPLRSGPVASLHRQFQLTCPRNILGSTQLFDIHRVCQLLLISINFYSTFRQGAQIMHNAYTRTDSHLNMRIQSRADPHGAEISVLMSNISLRKKALLNQQRCRSTAFS